MHDANVLASSTRGYDTWMQHFDSISSGVTYDTRHVEASFTAMTRGGKYLWTRLPYIILDTWWRQHLVLTPTQILQHCVHSMMNNLHRISSYLGSLLRYARSWTTILTMTPALTRESSQQGDYTASNERVECSAVCANTIFCESQQHQQQLSTVPISVV
jgi:hypothetical protein